MRRTTVFFDEQVARELNAVARRERRSAASIVREAVEQYIVTHRRGEDRRPGFIAIGASGRADTAERHEEVLWAEDAGRADAPTRPEARRRRPRPRRITGKPPGGKH
jgi:predicted transcriptional regulator